MARAAHASRFGRRSFTRPQLLACLALREHLGLSYRDTQAVLADVPDWRAAIDTRGTPDHNSLWRAFGARCSSRGDRAGRWT